MAKPDFDIDDLKKTWQGQYLPEIYNAPEIEQMLNKKSRNYVKYILWVSIVEFVFFVGLGFFLKDKKHSHLETNGIMKMEFVTEINRFLEHGNTISSSLAVLISLVFIYLFYQSYQSIKVEANLKKFILQIVRFKKMVNYYILINVLFFVLTYLLMMFYIGNLFHQNSMKTEIYHLYGIVVGMAIALLVIAFFMFIYYRLVYGILMKKLGRNLKQLRTIEQERDS